ncbi:MAG: AraC family transcriptional regulator, partial [Eubacteriales bacterium]|nr:AraC family transcriptional regulator [Eubacteriales bacterium]
MEHKPEPSSSSPHDIHLNMQLLQSMLQCSDALCMWRYSPSGELLSSNASDETAEVFALAFSLFGCLHRALSHAEEHDSPLIIGTPFGINWSCAFEKEDGRLHTLWVLGPAFYCDISHATLAQSLKRSLQEETSVAFRAQLIRIADQIPLLPNTILSRYTVMMHYCLTGQRVLTSDIGSGSLPSAPMENGPIRRDRYKTWTAEQELLQAVRTGDLDCDRVFSEGIALSNGVPVRSLDALRQTKTSIVVFTSLACRAAIEGGLSPEEAYSLGDSYIQTAESARTMDDLLPLSHLMYKDFVQRVHNRRANPTFSRPIQRCCDYISVHLEEKLRTKDLAALSGYTEYYLTQKFREETGQSLTDYIRTARIARARLLLRDSDLSIQEISERLCFGSRSYFTRVFTQITGTPPAQYRAEASFLTGSDAHNSDVSRTGSNAHNS